MTTAEGAVQGFMFTFTDFDFADDSQLVSIIEHGSSYKKPHQSRRTLAG
jgi:hypothetical protein